MRERKDWKKYLSWAAIALGCLILDAGFFLAVGGALKWIASLAAPAVWAAIGVAAIVVLRVIRLLLVAPATADAHRRVDPGTVSAGLVTPAKAGVHLQ